MQSLLLLSIIASLAGRAACLTDLNAYTATETVSSACNNISPGPATLAQLADLLVPNVVDLVATESIRNTLALYAFAVDGRNWAALARVFAKDARANYSEPLGVSYGIDNITESISAGIAIFAAMQHRYGTQFLQVCSPASAISVTYYTASHFFSTDVAPTVQNDSQTLYATGRYEDTWSKQVDGSWKIVNRNLVYSVSAVARLWVISVMKQY